MGRAPCCDKANVKRGPWSPEEDARLKAYIEEHGTGGNWIALPLKIGLKRCGKSCRLRWLNYLRPNIKHGGFSEEEDNIICSLYISIGSRWSIIAAQLPGRTDNDIKNYWNTRLKKKLLGKRKESQPRRTSAQQEPNAGHSFTSGGLSSSALERMQLQMQLHGPGSFSFYNNPALWPKPHPLGEKALQGQSSDAIAAAQMLLQFPTATSAEPCMEVPTPAENPDQLPSSAVQHDSLELDASSNNGLSSGLQEEEINELLLGLRSGQQHLFELEYLRDGTMSWTNIELGDKSSTSSWESAAEFQSELIFPDYMLGYGI